MKTWNYVVISEKEISPITITFMNTSSDIGMLYVDIIYYARR